MSLHPLTNIDQYPAMVSESELPEQVTPIVEGIREACEAIAHARREVARLIIERDNKLREGWPELADAGVNPPRLEKEIGKDLIGEATIRLAIRELKRQEQANG